MCAQTCLVSNLKRQASGFKLTISYIKGLESNVKVFREFLSISQMDSDQKTILRRKT